MHFLLGRIKTKTSDVSRTLSFYFYECFYNFT